jgi:iron complex transport system substrate-binding protein
VATRSGATPEAPGRAPLRPLGYRRCVRIVSLLPSTTEIVFAIGAGDELAGVTIECDYPPEARSRRVVSRNKIPAGLTPAEIDDYVRTKMAAGEDLYTLDEDAFRDIDPELVLTQDLCAVCAVDVSDVDAALTHLGCRGEVLTVDPATLDDVLRSIVTIGRAIGRADEAIRLEASLRQRLAAVGAAVDGRPPPRVVVIEWTDPPFTAGHWVPDVVTAAGGAPVVCNPGAPSVATTWRAVADAQPDAVVVAPCGYRLDAARRLAEDARSAAGFPSGVPLFAIDADWVMVRPGPRLVDGVEALASVLHPGTVAPRPELITAV